MRDRRGLCAEAGVAERDDRVTRDREKLMVKREGKTIPAVQAEMEARATAGLYSRETDEYIRPATETEQRVGRRPRRSFMTWIRGAVGEAYLGPIPDPAPLGDMERVVRLSEDTVEDTFDAQLARLKADTAELERSIGECLGEPRTRTIKRLIWKAAKVAAGAMQIAHRARLGLP